MSYPSSDFRDERFVSTDENDVDVIIIGAGLTGLTCAYSILKRETGLDVLIIEANSEVGGRVAPEMYSETFHANGLQTRITDLVRSLHIKTYRRATDNNKNKIFYTRRGAEQNISAGSAAEVYNFLQTVNENSLNSGFNTYTEHEDAEKLAKLSAEQLLQRLVYFPRARSFCRAYICSTCTAQNLDDVSALWLLVLSYGARGFLNRLKVTLGDNKRYFVQGGMTRITQLLLQRILKLDGTIRYVEPVRKIQFNDDRAYVTTDKNCFKCELVVVAVPPPESTRIIIQPRLSEDLLKMQSLYVPVRNVFFNVVYERPFWRNHYTGDILTTWDSRTNLKIAYDATHDDNTNEHVLAGFLAESDSTHTSKKGLFATLNECFEDANATEYLKYRECQRVQESYFLSNEHLTAGNPMSIMKPSLISDHVSCIGIPYERIFFASSEYALNWPGTVDGAIEAGEVTAYSILSILKPQALTFLEITKMTSKKRTQRASSFAAFAVQYLGIGLNVAIFLSFFKAAYPNI